MTPELTALVAELSNLFKTGSNYTVRRIAGQSAAALRELAGELEQERHQRRLLVDGQNKRYQEIDTLRAEVAALRKDAEYVRKAIAEISRESILGAAFAALGDSVEHEWYDKGWTGCVRALKRPLPLHCYVDPTPIDAAIADKQEPV